MLARSLSEVGMVTSCEGCVSVWSNGGISSVVIMSGVFACVKCLCVRGAKHI